MSDADENCREILLEIDSKFRNIQQIEEGSDTLFRLKDADGKKLIAKFRTLETLEKTWFEKEPLILNELNDTTDIPVPEIYEYSLSSETTYFMMNEMPGQLMSEDEEDLSDEEVLNLLEKLGHSLAEIHSVELEIEDRFGWIVNKKGNLHLEEEKNWPKMFESLINQRIDSIKDTEFSRYAPEVEKYYQYHKDILRKVNEPALAHDDFRPGNILVEGKEISGILDWARASLSDPEYDLVNTIFHFAEEIDLEDEKVEDRIIGGYKHSGDLSSNFEDKKDLYMACCVIGKMIGFSKVWGENYSDEKKDEISERLQTKLEEIILEND